MSKPQIEIWRGFGSSQTPRFNRVENKRAIVEDPETHVTTREDPGWVNEWLRDSDKARSVSQVGTMRTKIIP
jgi:hypothetical protein